MVTIPGAYHSKLSLGLLELSKLTGNTNYSRVSNAICDFAISLQKPDGRFETGPELRNNLFASTSICV